MPSRFLREGGFIKEAPKRESASVESILGDFGGYQPVQQYTDREKRDRINEMKKLMHNYVKTPAFAKSTPSTSVQSKDVSVFKVGMQVEHTRFGVGKIIAITGENAKIEFPVLGVKTFNLRLAPVKIVE